MKRAQTDTIYHLQTIFFQIQLYNPIDLTVTHSQDFSSQLLGRLLSICVASIIIQAKQNRITCSLRISQSSQLNAQVNKTRIMIDKKLPITG